MKKRAPGSARVGMLPTVGKYTNFILIAMQGS